jgi:hypothetical protein
LKFLRLSALSAPLTDKNQRLIIPRTRNDRLDLRKRIPMQTARAFLPFLVGKIRFRRVFRVVFGVNYSGLKPAMLAILLASIYIFSATRTSHTRLLKNQRIIPLIVYIKTFEVLN